MDIALALGIPNVDDLELLPQRIYDEWLTYFSDGPLLWRIFDQHFSRLESMIASVFRSKGAPQRRVVDFQIYATIRSEPSGEELFHKLLFINRLYGGEVIDKRSKDAQT